MCLTALPVLEFVEPVPHHPHSTWRQLLSLARNDTCVHTTEEGYREITYILPIFTELKDLVDSSSGTGALW